MMQHVVFVFIMPVVAIYMFRVLFAPIIRCIETVHADSGTIVFWYGVRAGWLGGNSESGTNRTML